MGAMKRAVPVADPLAMLACHLSGPLAAWRSLAEVTTRYSRGVDAAIRMAALSSIDLWVFTARARVPSHCTKTPTHGPIET